MKKNITARIVTSLLALASVALLSSTSFAGEDPITGDQRVSYPRPVKPEHLKDGLAGQLIHAEALIRSDIARNLYGYTGQGYSVAVIDTGIDYNHPDLGGGWGNKVVAGWNFLDNSSDPMDDDGHGTHVAGIIAGNGAITGIAPDANLIALRTLGGDGGSYDSIKDALRWVIEHREQYNIVAVNMSLGSGNFRRNSTHFINKELNALISKGVIVVAASGNDFGEYKSQPGMGFPAVAPGTVSVGAVWTEDFGKVEFGGSTDYTTGPDRVTSFTQRSRFLDLMAPGALIFSAAPGGGYTSMGGTSMAAPVVTGAAVLIRQMLDETGQYDRTSQCDLLGFLKAGGITILDGDDEDDNVVNTLLNFTRIDLLNSLNLVNETAYPSYSANPVELYHEALELKSLGALLRKKPNACLEYRFEQRLKRLKHQLPDSLISNYFSAEQKSAIEHLIAAAEKIVSGEISRPLRKRRLLSNALNGLTGKLTPEAISQVEFSSSGNFEIMLRQISSLKTASRHLLPGGSEENIQSDIRAHIGGYRPAIRETLQTGSFRKSHRRSLRRLSRSSARLSGAYGKQLAQERGRFNQNLARLHRALVRSIRQNHLTSSRG